MPRPPVGQSRQREPREHRNANPARIGMFSVTGSLPGQTPKTLELRPADYPTCQQIAHTLGQAWERSGRTNAFVTARTAHIGLRLFLDYLVEQNLFGWEQITPDFLRGYEAHIATIRVQPADFARTVWDFLRNLPEGTLPSNTATFVTHPPALAVRSYQPTEALPDDIMKAILRAAQRDITDADTRLARGAKYLTQQEITAYFILLLWETSWSMDVLKAFSFAPNAPTTVLNWNAGNGDFVEVRWLKERGGASQVRLLRTDGTWSAGNLLRRLEKATREARLIADRDDNSLPKGTPWLLLKEYISGPVGPYPEFEPGLYIVPLFQRDSVFAKWMEFHSEIPLSDIDGRITFRAIRPTAKAARLTLTDTSGLNVVDLVDDHTVEVYSSRYMRSARLMRELGKVFLEDIAGRAEEVAREWTPTIVATPEDGAASGLSADETADVLNGSMEFGLTACRTPTDSPMPGERAGDLCGMAFRACFTCPSAVVTPRHVTRMRTVRQIAMNQRNTVPPPQWEGIWRDTVDFIAAALARLEPQAANYPQAPADILDSGLKGTPSW